MTAAEFELAQEQIEDAYRLNKISSMELRRRMYALGFSPDSCDDLLDELDEQKQAASR
jgi:hypothetical protein